MEWQIGLLIQKIFGSKSSAPRHKYLTNVQTSLPFRHPVWIKNTAKMLSFCPHRNRWWAEFWTYFRSHKDRTSRLCHFIATWWVSQETYQFIESSHRRENPYPESDPFLAGCSQYYFIGFVPQMKYFPGRGSGRIDKLTVSPSVVRAGEQAAVQPWCFASGSFRM